MANRGKRPPNPPEPEGAGPPEDWRAQTEEMVRAALEHFMAKSVMPFFRNDILPQIQRQQSELIDAKMAEINTWLQTNVKVPDVQQLTQAVAAPISQEIKQSLIPRLEHLEAGLGVPQAQMPDMGQTPQLPVPRTPGQSMMGTMELAKALGETFLPLFREWKSLGNTDHDVDWAARLRAENPTKAIVLAQVLQPDPVLAQLPMMLANGIGIGMKARVMAQQFANGGDEWPATPGSPSPNSSGGVSSGPTGVPGTPSGGVSMQSRKTSRNENSRSGSNRWRTAEVRRLVDVMRRGGNGE